MTTIDSTSGGASANSYVSESEASDIASAFAYLPNSGVPTTGWSTANAEGRRVALVEAARRMETLAWQGEPSTTTQALSFPRVGLARVSLDGTVPFAVKQAQVAAACSLLSARDEVDAMREKGVRSATTGSVSIELGPGGQPDLPDVVSRMLRAFDLVAGSGAAATVRMPRS